MKCMLREEDLDVSALAATLEDYGIRYLRPAVAAQPLDLTPESLLAALAGHPLPRVRESLMAELL